MEITTTPPATPRFSGPPKRRPPVRPSRRATRRGERFEWGSLVPYFVHPAKVAIIEAMDWIDQPLSASELEAVLGVEKYSLGVVAYHVATLAKLGVIEATHERQVRGARETYYSFPRPT